MISPSSGMLSVAAGYASAASCANFLALRCFCLRPDARPFPLRLGNVGEDIDQRRCAKYRMTVRLIGAAAPAAPGYFFQGLCSKRCRVTGCRIGSFFNETDIYMKLAISTLDYARYRTVLQAPPWGLIPLWVQILRITFEVHSSSTLSRTMVQVSLRP